MTRCPHTPSTGWCLQQTALYNQGRQDHRFLHFSIYEVTNELPINESKAPQFNFICLHNEYQTHKLWFRWKSRNIIVASMRKWLRLQWTFVSHHSVLFTVHIKLPPFINATSPDPSIAGHVCLNHRNSIISCLVKLNHKSETENSTVSQWHLLIVIRTPKALASTHLMSLHKQSDCHMLAYEVFVYTGSNDGPIQTHTNEPQNRESSG